MCVCVCVCVIKRYSYVHLLVVTVYRGHGHSSSQKTTTKIRNRTAGSPPLSAWWEQEGRRGDCPSSSCEFLLRVCCVLRRSVVSSCSKLPWTVAPQAPLSMGVLQGKNTEVGYHALLQGSNPGLPHCRWFLSVWATKLEGGREITLFVVCVCFSYV